MGAVFTSCTRAAYWKVGLPFVGHDKYRFSTAAPPRYNPVTRLRLALHQPSYTLPLPIRFHPILDGLASTPSSDISHPMNTCKTCETGLKENRNLSFELDVYDFSLYFPVSFFFIFYSSVMIVDLKLKRLQSRQSSIIHYVECKERVLLCMLVKYFIIIFFFFCICTLQHFFIFM